ncbi:energy transducer TonB [Stakelama saccharophila]|uniref:Energy transducer TonB n=1 Tax=Stakelama saccharophila TaxID=3075605 RepID=A0ABZ0B688_9SPHN|nr:energy transducer TonB [Stakelama sp. W311]WNO52757.1 energy transducer TonB [Stakelama sp. W311]
MTSKVQIVRCLSSAALAAVFGSALLMGSVSPAIAAEREVDAATWARMVDARLDRSIRLVRAVPDSIRAEKGAVVAARFDAEGNFVDASLEQGTGNRLLDREAVRAVKAIRYPRLPLEKRGTTRVVAMEVFFADPIDHRLAGRVRTASQRMLAKYHGAENQNIMVAATQE